jgi:hypothetical protein
MVELSTIAIILVTQEEEIEKIMGPVKPWQNQ